MANKRQRAVGYGYMIADEQGRIQYKTYRSNRSDSWAIFLKAVGPELIENEKSRKRLEAIENSIRMYQATLAPGETGISEGLRDLISEAIEIKKKVARRMGFRCVPGFFRELEAKK